MENTENLIEKYKKELMSFSHSAAENSQDKYMQKNDNKMTEFVEMPKETSELGRAVSVFSVADDVPVTDNMQINNAIPVQTNMNNQTNGTTANQINNTANNQTNNTNNNLNNNNLGPANLGKSIYDNPPSPPLSMEQFMNENQGRGYLKVQVYASERAFPISNATVRVNLLLKGGEEQVFAGLTDANGIVDNITLAAPTREASQSPDSNSPAYSYYNVTVDHPRFARARYQNIPIFDGIKSIQSVEMIPLSEYNNQPNTITTNESQPSVGGAS